MKKHDLIDAFESAAERARIIEKQKRATIAQIAYLTDLLFLNCEDEIEEIEGHYSTNLTLSKQNARDWIWTHIAPALYGSSLYTVEQCEKICAALES